MALILTVRSTDALLSTHPVSLFALFNVYSIKIMVKTYSDHSYIFGDFPNHILSFSLVFILSSFYVSKRFQEFYLCFTNQDMEIKSGVYTRNSVSLLVYLDLFNWITLVSWNSVSRLQANGKSTSHLVDCFLMSTSETSAAFRVMFL